MAELETEASQQKIKSFLENNDCFSIANYHVIKKKIGMGSFATIYHGIEKDIAKDVAIKRIHVKDIKKIAPNVKKEIEIMKDLSHPNIIKMYDVIYENDFDNVNIIMEYASLGNLYDCVKKEGTITEIYSKYYLRQVAKGLKYLLSKNIIHRDLKPHNILLFENNIVKLADFGLARSFQEDQYFNTLCGSPLYMAPEIVLPLTNKDNKLKKPDKIYTIKADLWSIGIILYEMITGKYPITPKTLHHLPQQLHELEIKIPNNIIISNECNDLISRLLIKDPLKRIEWNDFFMHSWFSINEIKEEKKKIVDNENKLLEYAEQCINDKDNNFSLYKFSPLSPLNQLNLKTSTQN
jgi:serine/threonine protein kinase